MSKESDNKVRVKAAELHSPIRIAGKTESSFNASKMPTAQLFWTPVCLLIRLNGESVIVPHANVKFAQLESPEEKLKQ